VKHIKVYIRNISISMVICQLVTILAYYLSTNYYIATLKCNNWLRYLRSNNNLGE
jgi:hypothetical protein